MSLDSSRSANSGQKSKRSFNSSYSNNSNNGSKKKKVNQKTLGVAWGSNSVSSSRSSFRKSPFSDFGSYMEEKSRKLRSQFDSDASNSSHGASASGRPIFHGVSIFVDGFTVPSNQELRGYMLKYGGRFENYFSRHRVSHIICSNLPDSKIKNLRSFSAGLPVVKPTWILDSVAANKLLSWVPYQLDQLSNNQPKLSDFFARKSNPVSDNASSPVACQVQPESADSSLNDDTSKNADLSELVESMEDKSQIQGDTEFPLQDYTDEIKSEQEHRVSESSEVNMTEVSSSDSENKNSVKTEGPDCLLQPSASVNSYCSENQIMEGSASSPVSGVSSKRHSTLGDPNFVENYFKSSRLHFIGTWRNRYRKRFPDSSGFNCSTSGLKVSTEGQRTCIIHVDMDCFFVSVIIRNHPELKDKPVAVCHSDNPKGTAEISSANYPARDYGVKAGMFVKDAKVLCPNLVIFPYDFEGYEEVADQFYNILHKRCNRVQAVSCDEAFLDVTGLAVQDPDVFALEIRTEILESTRCTASAGIAGNMLMARLATRTAKPDGQCHIPPESVDEYLDQLPIKALPGIGYVLEEKLKKRNVWTCGELRLISKDSLQKDFGTKTGEMLWNYSRGVDNRLVGMIKESKSIGAEVNWGVRFRDLHDSKHFLISLCKEVSLRLQGCGVQGRTFTLKIKKRKKDAGEPVKYMGCGDCDNLSHSMTVPVATDDLEVLQRIAKQLFGSFHLDVKDIRGVGLQVTKLQNADARRQEGVERNTLKSWLTSASAGKEGNTVANGGANIDFVGQSSGGNTGQLSDAIVQSVQRDHNLLNGRASSSSVSAPPPLSQLDIGVIKDLPPELFSELNEIYGGKLVDFIAKSKGKSENTSNSALNAPAEPQAVENRVEMSVSSGLASLTSTAGMQIERCVDADDLSVPVGGGVGCEAGLPMGLYRVDLMPSSLSQVDTSVLQQLPEELKVDILGQLPAHRWQEFSFDAASKPPEVPDLFGTITTENLWVGTPPRWVHKFKLSNLSILNILAEMYETGSTETLSQIFQRTVSISLHSPDASSKDWDEAICNLCELLKQYIKLKIEVDIEEIYLCFRLLRRITMKSELLLQVYDIVLPELQTSVGEYYGGSIHI